MFPGPWEPLPGAREMFRTVSAAVPGAREKYRWHRTSVPLPGERKKFPRDGRETFRGPTEALLHSRKETPAAERRASASGSMKKYPRNKGLATKKGPVDDELDCASGPAKKVPRDERKALGRAKKVPLAGRPVLAWTRGKNRPPRGRPRRSGPLLPDVQRPVRDWRFCSGANRFSARTAGPAPSDPEALLLRRLPGAHRSPSLYGTGRGTDRAGAAPPDPEALVPTPVSGPGLPGLPRTPRVHGGRRGSEREPRGPIHTEASPNGGRHVCTVIACLYGKIPSVGSGPVPSDPKALWRKGISGTGWAGLHRTPWLYGRFQRRSGNRTFCSVRNFPDGVRHVYTAIPRCTAAAKGSGTARCDPYGSSVSEPEFPDGRRHVFTAIPGCKAQFQGTDRTRVLRSVRKLPRWGPPCFHHNPRLYGGRQGIGNGGPRFLRKLRDGGHHFEAVNRGCTAECQAWDREPRPPLRTEVSPDGRRHVFLQSRPVSFVRPYGRPRQEGTQIPARPAHRK